MILRLKYNSIHHIKNYSTLPCGVSKLPRFLPNHKHSWQTTSSLRSRFIDYFLTHEHKYINPCSLNSKSTGSYFVNSGVTQFKDHILGQKNIFSDVHKAVNSQRCVRLGGKHCDLKNIGYDSTHLSYFEMLGNWSFGSYDKSEACKLMWKFLTEELELPPSHLYVTYFGGSEKLGLAADDETRDIWFSIGVKDSKVLQFGEEHNFWEMGKRSQNTLCGPSTEIHWDYLATMNDSKDPRCARCFVNSPSPEVTELWNCVFMEYKWIDGGKTLSKLPALIIDTGMGLERLASVIQGVCSVFDTDGFKNIMNNLSVLSKSPEYQGSYPMPNQYPVSQRLHTSTHEINSTDDSLRRDVAYRVIADHLRTICLCVNDGIRPGRQGVELKVRQLLHRALRQSKFGLGMIGGLSAVVDTVCQSLNQWYNIDPTVQTKLKNIIDKEENIFMPKLSLYEKSFDNFLLQRQSAKQELTEKEVSAISNGEFGESISVDLIRAMCQDAGLNISDSVLNEDHPDSYIVEKLKPVPFADSNLLLGRNIPVTYTQPTYNYRFNQQLNLYEVADIETSITALILLSPLNEESLSDDISEGSHTSKFGLLTTETNMFPTKGGQECDKGVLKCVSTDEVIATVDSVSELDSGHTIHWCTFVDCPRFMRVSDKVKLHVDSVHRTGNTLHHTGHHIVFAALNKLLGRVNQASSSVKSDQARMGFTIDVNRGVENILSNDNFCEQIEKECREMITNQMPVQMKNKVKFSQISDDSSVRYLKSEGLCDEVRLVSIGDTSEVCCGTHAENTGHLQDIVITSLKKSNQTISEISFVTGRSAIEIRKRDEKLRKLCEESDQLGPAKWDQIDGINKKLKLAFAQNSMSKGTRKILMQSISKAERQLIAAPSISDILFELFSNVDGAPKETCIVHVKTLSIKRALWQLQELKVTIPVIMYDSHNILVYFPKRNVYNDVRKCLEEFLKTTNHSISDFVVELPKVRKIDDVNVLGKFVAVHGPEKFDDFEKFVIHLSTLMKDL